MIEIFTGPASAVGPALRQVADRSASSGLPAVVLEPSSPLGRSWDGIRSLLAGVSAWLGRERLISILGEDAPASGLLLDAVPWDGVDPRRRGELCAHLDSHLSHNWAIRRSLLEAWAERLRRLSAESAFLVVVPEISRLDKETIGVLKTLYRTGGGPELVLGYDPDPPASELDERGIGWGVAPDFVLEAVLGLRSIPEARCHDLTSESPGKETRADHTALGSPEWDRSWDLESRAWATLDRAQGRRLEDREVELVAEAQWRAFQRFGFTSALRLGLELVDRNARLEGRLAQVHAVLALSAHNRQFHAAGNLRLAELIDRHLRLALDHQDRSALRSALLYRLAVTAGRRRGRFDEAIGWADLAVEEARRVAHPWKAAYLEGWARNIRSYARMRAKLRQEAKRDCEQAFELLSKAHERGPGDLPEGEGPTRRDLAASLALLATNRSVLSWLDRDDPGFERWRGAAWDLEGARPGAARFEAGGWVEFHRYRNRPDLGLASALAGLDSARRELDVLRERRYLLEAADASYRLGQAAEARSFFRQEKQLRAKLGHPPYLADPSVASAGASARAGYPAEAESLLASVIENPETWPRAALAEIWGAAGALAARRGDTATAEARVNRAIEIATETGERDVLLQVAIQAAEALGALGRDEEAKEAYRRALDLAQSSTDDAEPPRAGDLFKAKLGIAELSGRVDRHLFALVPAALDDPECWWSLARLRSLCPDGRPSEVPESDWQTFLAAARLRKDCTAPATSAHEQRRSVV